MTVKLEWVTLFLLGLITTSVAALDATVQIPDSLGKWYKPENKRQVWLHTMFGMRRELQALQEYTEEADLQGIQKWSAKLIKHYRSLPEMVPEWLDEVELDTVEDLERAVERGDLVSIKSATRKLDRSCKGCHSDYQLVARLRYRTADFNQLKITQNGETFKHSTFKKNLIRTLNRIKISSEDGRWQRAESSLNQLKIELDALGQTCSTCHKDKQAFERILGSATQQGLNKLQGAIIDQDVKQTGRSLGGTAVNICARCHGVHRSLSEIRQQLFGSTQ